MLRILFRIRILCKPQMLFLRLLYLIHLAMLLAQEEVHHLTIHQEDHLVLTQKSLLMVVDILCVQVLIILVLTEELHRAHPLVAIPMTPTRYQIVVVVLEVPPVHLAGFQELRMVNLEAIRLTLLPTPLLALPLASERTSRRSLKCLISLYPTNIAVGGCYFCRK